MPVVTHRTRFLVAALAAIALSAQTPSPAPPASAGAASVEALRSRIKHVFVIFQENHSFDTYFGTYPGAENLASPLAQTHGFRQYDPIGKTWVEPFRIADPDIEGPSQARTVIERKIDGGKMDGFVSAQEAVSLKKFGDPAAARSIGMLTMAHYDCDTIPFLWKYAKTFALFDHMFETMTGPSTPNNIAIIAGQSGQSRGTPVFDDADPAFGPYSEADDKHQLSQQYATLPLLLGGSTDARVTRDTQGVAGDLAAVAAMGQSPVPWGWYQEGYVSPTQALAGYVTHHNAPQYFGYLRNNDAFWNNVHGLTPLLDALRNGTLPDRGLFYVKGGGRNGFGWKPANPDPFVQANYLGDDDHPGRGDSDHQIGEAFVATFVNAIARSKYWNDSAIVVAWDDPGGFYDHVPPRSFETCADGLPCGDGPRVPYLVISPYAKSGAIVSQPGDANSLLKFVETVYGLPALASLPDEHPAHPSGPRDASPEIGNLLAAFDPGRLDGSVPPIPAEQAEIPDPIVNAFPAAMNCASLGIIPVRLPNAPSTPPPGFTPRVAAKPIDD